MSCSTTCSTTNITKLVILILLCLVGLGSYFCYDAPVALEVPLKKYLNLTQSQYNGLYYAYSYPNVIVCPLGGLLVDTILGKRMAGIAFTGFIMLGQFITAWGTWVGELWLMDMGRFVFGLGGETLVTVQNAYCVSWYSGSILNLAMGIVLSVSRFGSVVSLNVLGTIFDNLDETNGEYDEPKEETVVLGKTMVIAGLFTILSFFGAFLLGFADYKFPPNSAADEDTKSADAKNTVDTISVSSVSSVEKTFSEKMHGLLQKLKFPLGSWLVFVICVFYYSTIFPLISQGTEFYITRYNVSEDTATSLNSMPYLISLPAVPIFGALIDYTQHNVAWVLGSCVITAVSFVFMLITSITPWVPVTLLGIGYALLACSMWPMVSFLVPESQLGSAYGVMQAIQNLGLALTGQISGMLIDGFEDKNDGYFWLIIMFLGFQAICILANIWLWQRHGVNCEPLPSDEGQSAVRLNVTSASATNMSMDVAE